MTTGAKLSVMGRGRDNNFNLIRFLAASMVLYNHSFAVARRFSDAQPVASYGRSPGAIAVDVFFITSGFLVTGSLLSRRSAASFLSARALRIFPALWVMLCLTVFVLGPLLTASPAWTCLHSLQTWGYLGKNGVLVGGIAWALPGLFLTNPLPNVVNASLWTLEPEVHMYGALLVLWLLASRGGASSDRISRVAFVLMTIASGMLYFHRGRSRLLPDSHSCFLPELAAIH